jgi:adenylosuccinate synthase
MSKIYVVVDLGYGDQGKGATVDYLTRATGAGTIVRFNGGCQAAHHVVTADGRNHKFSQFGAGMFVDDTTTYLSQFMLVQPKAMIREAEFMEQRLGIANPMSRTFIDSAAPIITPFHQATNRVIEIQRNAGAHGSCGAGIGELMEDVIERPELVVHAADLVYPSLVKQKLELIKDHKWTKLKGFFNNATLHQEAAQEIQDCFIQDGVIDYFLKIYARFADNVHVVPRVVWADLVNQNRPVIMEAAQGVLLDEWHGFHPHTTWSTTTFKNADEMLASVGFTGEVTKIGVTRAYSTRHGAGPFVVEDADMTRRLPEAHNSNNRWQGGMRAGWLDMVALKYACDVAGSMDYLAVTCLDRVRHLGELKVCTEYQTKTGPMPLVHTESRDLVARSKITQALGSVKPKFEDVEIVDNLLTKIQSVTGTEPRLLSYGPTAEDRVLTGALASVAA